MSRETASYRTMGSTAGSAPAARSRIPPELEALLAKGEGLVTLLRGPSGSGKTAIAAELAARWPGPVIWATTRTALSDKPVPEEAARFVRVDLSLTSSIRDGSTEDLFAARDALLHWFEPGTSGDPRDSFPRGLAEVLPDHPTKPSTLLAIDSWDGLLDRYLDLTDPSGGNALRPGRLERTLLSLLHAMGVSLLMVSERGGSDLSDPLADVVLVTAVAEFEERLVRIFALPKVRGRPVTEPVYPYTLSEGRFTFVPRLSAESQSLAIGAEPDPDPTDHSSVWPGSRAFVDAFGRLPVGELSLLELDPTVPPEASRLLTAGAALPTLLGGGNLLLVVPPDVDLERMVEGFRALAPDAELARRVRILSAREPPLVEAPLRPIFIAARDPGQRTTGFIAIRDEASLLMQPVFPETSRLLRASSSNGAANLAVVMLEGLESAGVAYGRPYAPETVAGLLRQDVIGAPAHIVVISRSDDPLIPGLRGVANPYLRILERQGRVFIVGVRPWTPAFVLIPRADALEGPLYELLRMS